jgi:hypothetical protein
VEPKYVIEQIVVAAVYGGVLRAGGDALVFEFLTADLGFWVYSSGRAVPDWAGRCME